MLYHDFHGKKLSALGLGCMRLPVCGEDNSAIDMDAAREMVKYAIENGVNYFDTAWGYHGGQSEPVMGELLKAYPRDSFYLASKFPGFLPEYTDKIEEVFEKQLARCQVDYFDFYLLHNVNDTSVELYLDPKYRMLDYLLEQKRRGRIHHLGFSVHASKANIRRFLEVYGEYMEFGQLQLNWLDWEHIDTKGMTDLLTAHNIPVWVMEPVRGGSLVNLNPVFEARLQALNPRRSNVEWAFRFVQSVPQVVMTLSGMSNLKQLKQNIAIFEEHQPLNAAEIDTLMTIGRDMMNKDAVPCTACRYCVPECPAGLNIPYLASVYNASVYAGKAYTLPEEFSALSPEGLPSACISCGACEKVCPQNIKIYDMMTKFTEKLLHD